MDFGMTLLLKIVGFITPTLKISISAATQQRAAPSEDDEAANWRGLDHVSEVKQQASY
jgi:hypothetical protein